MSFCHKLQVLKLSHNAIEDLKGIELLYDLRELAVDSNLLKHLIHLRPLSMLLELCLLNVRNNPLSVKLDQKQVRAMSGSASMISLEQGYWSLQNHAAAWKCICMLLKRGASISATDSLLLIAALAYRRHCLHLKLQSRFCVVHCRTALPVLSKCK